MNPFVTAKKKTTKMDFSKVIPPKNGDHLLVEIYGSCYEGRGGSGKITYSVTRISKGDLIPPDNDVVGHDALEDHDKWGGDNDNKGGNIAFVGKNGVLYRSMEIPNKNVKLLLRRFDDSNTHYEKNGTYLVIKTNHKKDGTVGKRIVKVETNFDEACKKLLIGGTQSCQTDVYEITEKGNAVLIGSTAAIQNATDEKTTGFSCFDRAYNPYDDCSFKCAYCYNCALEDFRCLPEDLTGRVVIGTHVDPYQHAEAKEKRTQKVLKQLLLRQDQNQATKVGDKEVTKVGIYTKSPMVARDLKLIAQLPNPQIHLALSPYDEKTQKKLEPGAPTNAERLAIIPEIKKYPKIKLIINICPCLPTLSENAVEIFFHEAYKQADEICIGLTCLYGDIPDQLVKLVGKKVIDKIRTGWDHEFMAHCRKVFAPYMNDKLVIWRDAGRMGWKNLKDMSFLPQEFYRS